LSGLITSKPVFPMALAVCGGGIASYALAALQLPLGGDLARHVAWFLFAFAFYLVAVVLVLLAKDGERDRISLVVELGLILVVAVLLRVAFLFTSPSLSDDVFRYVWDGRLVNAGISPYLYPPSAPELAAFRGPLWEGINHKSMATPYPPLAEALFAATYRLFPDSVTAMQEMATAFDMGVVVLLLAMLDRLGLDLRRVLIYAWNPLILLQFGHSAHFDSAMLLLLLAAIYLLGRGRRVWSGALLGASILVKVVPALVVPAFLPVLGPGGLLALGTLSAVGFLPWIEATGGLAGLSAEAGDARFNDSLGYLLLKLMERFTTYPEALGRGFAAGLLFACSWAAAAYIWRRRGDWRVLLEAAFGLIGLFLLLNAVVEPWYLTWMIPFLCLLLPSEPKGRSFLDPTFGWLLMSGFVVLTDLVYIPGFPLSLWLWIRAVEYGPLYLMLGLWGWRTLGRFQEIAALKRLR